MNGTGSHPPLLLVDGFNLLWSGTFGFPAEIRSRDRTRLLTGLFAFFALLRAAIRKDLTTPPEVLVVFDGQHGGDARRSLDPAYKAQRPDDEQALSPLQYLADIKRGLDQSGISWLEHEDHEADDVIATLTQRAHRLHPGRYVIIMSRDQDFYQLVNDHVHVLNTRRRAGQRFIDAADIRDRHDVHPQQWPDLRALAGDPADNIPGVPGIGMKTAAALLSDGLTLADLPDSGRLDTGRGRTVRDHWDDVRRWRDMIQLDGQLDVPDSITGVSSSELPLPAVILEGLGAW